MVFGLCFLFVGFAVFAFAASPGFPGHGMICDPDEDFLECGSCQATCKEPEAACASVCRVGCYCRDGRLRNTTGKCILPEECPEDSNIIRKERAAPCGPNEEYLECGVCHRTCDNPNPICPAQCTRGCFCKDDYVRHSNNECVKVKECPQNNGNN